MRCNLTKHKLIKNTSIDACAAFRKRTANTHNTTKHTNMLQIHTTHYRHLLQIHKKTTEVFPDCTAEQDLDTLVATVCDT